MAKFTSLNINGKPVKTLYIDGKQVAIGSDEQLGYLCFTAEEANSTVRLTGGNTPAVSLQTSVDGNTWTNYQLDDTITLANVGDKVYFKATDTNRCMADDTGDHDFMMTGKIAASGNVNTLLTEDLAEAKTMSLEGRDKCFQYLFYECTALTQAPELPATTLASDCYSYMFYGCASLTQAPELPATTLASYCYHQMFYNCTSLTQAPQILPATTLASQCYYNMFSGCTALTQAPALQATALAYQCCQQMFSGCTALTQAPALPATTLADYCYSEMFDNCTSLTQAPALPATTLANNCYSRMFWNCTSLTQAPVLSATTLASGCYNYMFRNCTNLNYVKVGFTNWSPSNATSYWLPDNTGTFECPWDLITNTSTRTASTVPSTWSMIAV